MLFSFSFNLLIIKKKKKKCAKDSVAVLGHHTSLSSESQLSEFNPSSGVEDRVGMRRNYLNKCQT